METLVARRRYEEVPHSDTRRAETFSDGVLAIVITPLVLRLKSPAIATGGLLAQLLRQWPPRKTLDLLVPHVRDGRTVVGIEPSCIATLRSDLVELLPDDPRAAKLSRSVKTIAEFVTSCGEWYGVLDLWPVTAATAAFEGHHLGRLAPVDPPVRFGFGSVPLRPALVRVTTTVEGVGRRGLRA
ncbi:TMEM175 family protein [Streptomyces sp. NRRL S-1824]|uniref:TMEM175 family protein n=1 Tax=Streptomyces sp. NRRL S-1824 TaxID=1463889 RepID=UPI00068A4FF6